MDRALLVKERKSLVEQARSARDYAMRLEGMIEALDQVIRAMEREEQGSGAGQAPPKPSQERLEGAECHGHNHAAGTQNPGGVHG